MLFKISLRLLSHTRQRVRVRVVVDVYVYTYTQKKEGGGGGGGGGGGKARRDHAAPPPPTSRMIFQSVGRNPCRLPLAACRRWCCIVLCPSSFLSVVHLQTPRMNASLRVKYFFFSFFFLSLPLFRLFSLPFFSLLLFPCSFPRSGRRAARGPRRYNFRPRSTVRCAYTRTTCL